MKYSRETTEEICKYIRAGNNYEDSADLAHVGVSTLYDWQREKESDGTPNPNYHVEFVEAIKSAEKECKARCITIVLKAGEKSWQAAAWFLERKYHDEFALKQLNEYTGRNGEPIKIQIVTYGPNDPLAVYAREAEPAGTPSITAPVPVSGSQLAQEGAQDNPSDKPVGKVG